VDYSLSGDPVNLGAETAASGHARGDKLSGMENVIASAKDDLLIGDNGADRMQRSAP